VFRPRLTAANATSGVAHEASLTAAARPDSRRRRRRRLVAAVVAYLVAFLVVLPILWIVLLSFESNDQILSHPFSIANLNTKNYQLVLSTLHLLRMYKNTFILAAVSVVVGVGVSFMLAFAITRMVWRRQWLQTGTRYFFLIGLTIPVYVLLFPVYRINLQLHVFGTYWALIFPYVAGAVSFDTLLFIGFLSDFPDEIERAGIVDGCNLWMLCRHIVLPMMRPIISTVAVFNLLYVWNEFPFAVTLINKTSQTTVALGISEFQGAWLVNYGAMMASSVLVLVPQLIVYALLQRNIVEGMTLGAVKG
jgi:raffinose/stachyose/melibiose transport system permease protein